jgi:transcriptional regulator with XRE-family HTH domain
MCPPDSGKKPRTPPATRRRENLANWRLMRWLDEERTTRGLSLRQIGESLGYLNATRVGQYFHQKIVPGAEIVRRLAIAIGVSPIDALWRAEHYSAVFDYLDDLYRLGWSWMRADCVHLDRSAGAMFTLQYRGAENAAITQVPPSLAHRYHRTTIYNMGGGFRVVSLPKPMACAILLGIGLFPRRGDRVRPEARPFIQELSVIASEMLIRAERVKAPSDRRPLKAAEDILRWRLYPGPMRLAVVAEYVHAWCDFACAAYADFARLVLYDRGGFVREPSQNENIWEYQKADIPSPDQLRLDVAHLTTGAPDPLVTGRGRRTRRSDSRC